MELLTRALGSLPDAAWIRRQFTLDADAAHDAMHGARMLLKAPGFTAIALLVFAIGIGATTAIVSVADALFVRRLPVRQPERVMTVWQYNRETGATQQDVAPANAIDWIKRVQSFETVAVAEPWTVQSTIGGREPVALEAARVGEQFFTVLGTPMLHGRAFLPQEYQRGGERVAIFSYGLWRDSFGSDVSLIGRSVRLIGHVADSQARTCSLVNGEQKAVNATSKTTKADLVAALKESYAICDTAFDALTDAGASQMVRLGQSSRERSKLGLLAGMISHSNELSTPRAETAV